MKKALPTRQWHFKLTKNTKKEKITEDYFKIFTIFLPYKYQHKTL